jgi:phospholipid/cholesterol/gamma-HCH transport system ATP-binding protein
MTSVDTIADKVAMLHRGRIQWCGARADLAHSGDPHVEQFVNGRAEGPIETLR